MLKSYVAYVLDEVAYIQQNFIKIFLMCFYSCYFSYKKHLVGLALLIFSVRCYFVFRNKGARNAIASFRRSSNRRFIHSLVIQRVI